MPTSASLATLRAALASRRSLVQTAGRLLRAYGPVALSVTVMVLFCSTPAFAQTGGQDILAELEGLRDFLRDNFAPLIIVIAFIISGLMFAFWGKDALTRIAMVVAGAIVIVCSVSIAETIWGGF